jgi:hypothetical protein
LRPRPRVIGRQQTTAHEEAQQPPAYALLHRGDGGRTDQGEIRSSLAKQDSAYLNGASSTPVASIP